MTMCRTIIGVAVCLMLVTLQGVPAEIRADDAGKPWVSRVVSIQGHVLIKRQDKNDWQPAGLDDTLFAGDQIRIAAKSRAGIVLSNDAVLRLDQNTTLVFTEIERPGTFVIELLKGAANFFSHRPRSLKIVTPFVNGVVEGTEFYVQVDDGQTRIDLFEGRILAQNPHGELLLSRGQGAVSVSGQAPQVRILVKPRDSVQWALYYPPVLTVGPEQRPAGFSEVMALYNQGQSADALDRMEAIDQKDRNAHFFTLRAGLLLNVGRVDQATEDIRQALTLDAANSEALALQAVIAVVQNRKDESLTTAQKAVQNNPRSAASHMALSYAHQAAFSLPEALQEAVAAVSIAPDNGTAWARLAELQLSTGELDQGTESARRAAALNPRNAHAHTILGFAYLTRIKTQKAREAFEQAIALDSAAPLPRLGLGLAIIRTGDLEQGRSQIEIAAGLAPSNALIRSYLGKAYFDEKRGPLDQGQFEIAKQLDPNDPTPYLYDAILKQSLNRPVEALQDLQKSIELNDNRAVFRSRFMLDRDLASRSASLSRIYWDLNFQELAIRGGLHALNLDPANYSAHRLLADTYASRPRHDISRVSELLQAQLLQPINMTPIQPQLAETNLFILNGAGPAEPSFGEFNPLFVRNRIAAQLSGIAGHNDTIGDEIVLSAVKDSVSLSVGQFYYETDGFRENDDLKHEIYNAFVQIGLTHKTSIQSEIHFRDTERGDPYLRFEPDNFFPTLRHPQEIRSGRFGFHHKATPRSDVIGSLIYTDIENRSIIPDFAEVETLDDGYVAEVQHLIRQKAFNLTAGMGYLNGDRQFAGNVMSYRYQKKYDLENLSGYLYSNMRWPSEVTWTLGFSASKFNGFIDEDQFNPKMGVTWNIFDRTTLRAAAFRVLEDTLIAKQRLEPTHVAGFNQFYEEVLDGGEAVDAWNYGIGIDQQISNTLSCGVEYIKRELDVPYILDLLIGTAKEVEWDDETVRLYLYASPLNWLTLDFGYQFERYNRESEYTGDEDFAELTTHRFPVGARIFLPSGFFAGVKATYVDQEGIFGSNPFPLRSDEDTFWVFDANIGYRLPRRFGIITVDGKNIFDESFKFQDTDPSRPTIFPDQQILVKLTLSF